MEEIVLNAAIDWLGGQTLAGIQTLLSSLSFPETSALVSTLCLLCAL